MRSSIAVFLFVLVHGLAGQFADDFSDGDFGSNPEWIGQTGRFMINSQELQLNAPKEAGESYLVTSSAGLDNGVWEFKVIMEFGTSGSNYCQVYLMSSSSSLSEDLNGYFVQIGDTPDEISLFRKDGAKEVVLIDGVDKLIESSSVNVRVRVTRDANGRWELFHDITGGSSFQSAGTASDNTYRITDFFGVRCIYTSTRSDKFFFDDFMVSGTPILDKEPPLLLSLEAENANAVSLVFSEEIDPSSIQLNDFNINQGVEVLSVNVFDNMVVLEVSDLTNGRNYEVVVDGISDLAGNELADESGVFRYLVFSEAERGDILLTEVLFNPRPGGVDFIELYNSTSDKYFDLGSFLVARIANNELEQIRLISAEEIVFEPGQYLALSEDSSTLAFEYPTGDSRNFVTIDDLPSYNDDEGTIVFLSADLDTLQFFSYQDDYHYELLEDEEGVSLERIVLNGEENDPNIWRSAASVEGFATPGKPNSQRVESLEAFGRVTIEPKVFIPGNAGTGRDFTTINYELSTSGQFANVYIYDQSGRIVKEIANGASLSSSGFFRWDGINDEGGQANMGYHIVVFELYDGRGGTSVIRETVVVGRDF